MVTTVSLTDWYVISVLICSEALSSLEVILLFVPSMVCLAAKEQTGLCMDGSSSKPVMKDCHNILFLESFDATHAVP